MMHAHSDLSSMMPDNTALNHNMNVNVNNNGRGGWDTAPVVTMAMLQCQMCTQQFSMSGKLSDHRTPVLAVNPSHSIEGPYCIACAGKRDGLRSFQIDEARVALCKLWHQQQQLSMGGFYAALQHHQQQQQRQSMTTTTTATDTSTTTTSNMPVSAAAADITRRVMAAKQDAPGLLINGINNSTGGRRSSLDFGMAGSTEDTTLGLPASALPEEYAAMMAGVVGHNGAAAPLPSRPNNKRQKVGNSYVKTTWTEAEDAILIQAVTSSSEQPFTRWSDLAHQLPGRVGKQIRDRWLNHLDPKIDRSPFTRDEDRKLYEAFKKHGKRWVEISTKFFDSKRSENHVKNRWYSAAFKKFVRQELGEDPFDSNNSTTNNSRAAKKNREELSSVVDSSSNFMEEKKEEA